MDAVAHVAIVARTGRSSAPIAAYGLREVSASGLSASLLWHYQQLRVSLRAKLGADPAGEDLASELSCVDTQVSVKEDKLRKMKSLSELINEKVCFINQQMTAIEVATTYTQMWQKHWQEASRKLVIALCEFQGLMHIQASAQQQELQATRETVTNLNKTGRTRMSHIVLYAPRGGAVTPQPQDVVTSATGAGCSCGGPESTADLPTEPISEKEMYSGKTDSDLPSDVHSSDLESNAFHEYLARRRRHKGPANPWRVRRKHRRKRASRGRSRPPPPQQEEQAAAAPAEQAPPSSSRGLLTSLPPRIAGQFPTHDDVDARVAEWHKAKNDFYEDQMRTRGPLVVQTFG